MYSRRSGLIIGFHGCDKKLRDDVVSKEGITLNSSENKYDWLGNGTYFWENNKERALQFAEESKERFLNLDSESQEKHINSGKTVIKNPAVLGVVLDLGFCLDLLDSEYLKILKESYNFLCKSSELYSKNIPENIIADGELLLRNLDCAVIETTHQLNRELDRKEYDSVRGVFIEGNDLYKNAGFKEKNHIQIAIRNPNCIKGYFIPRELDSKFGRIK